MESKVLIIGRPEETPEQKVRKIIQSIYTRCFILDRYDLNIKEFKEHMLGILQVEDVDTLEMLEAYEKLEEEQKDELVKSCTSAKPHLENDFILGDGKTLALALSEEACREEHLYRKDDLYSPSETELRKLIKRAKNPLEKQALQRQLSYCTYMCGKHRKGKKHGR